MNYGWVEIGIGVLLLVELAVVRAIMLRRGKGTLARLERWRLGVGVVGSIVLILVGAIQLTL